MSGLKIGGHRGNTSGEPALINLGQVEPTEPTTVEPVTTEPTVEPTEPVQPTEPVVEPVTTEPVATEPTVTEPVVTTTEPDSSLNTEPAPTVQPELNDEAALKFLSEKLGRQITSFDEINKTTENPLEKDPYLKGLYEWREKTGRPIEDWVKYQKDYDKLSDVQVAREILQHKYPTLTPDEINLELSKYQATEDDIETEASLKALELKKLATEGRATLKGMVAEFGEPSALQLSPEMQQDLDLAKQVKLQSVEQDRLREEYSQGIVNAATQKESLSLQLSDDLTIDFKMTEENRNALPESISEMAHWRNEDGSWNHNAVVEDGIKIKHFPEIIKLVFEQGLNAGKEALAKQANNTTLSSTTTIASQTGDSSKGIKIEGLDSFIGGKGMKIRKR